MKHPSRTLRALAVIVFAGQFLPASVGTAAAATVIDGFQLATVWSGLSTPTAIAFAPNGRVFVAERDGIVKTFDSVADPSPTVTADLRTKVHSVGDRGLLGLAVDPGFPTRPYIYVAYMLDAPPGGTAPYYNDACPLNNGHKDGCPATGRVSRLTINASGQMSGTETVLIGGNYWCHQQQGHALDHLEFGPDGALYASSGDGGTASFTDWGQHFGNPAFVAPNACGDPPTPAGTQLALPTTQGGALRSQDLRTSADPAGGSGAIVRFSPDTGQALPDNPLIGGDASDDRHVAYGFRNPFRFTFRPGTTELWVADVGWNTWEELNLVPNPTQAPKNFGWPCYEGGARQPQFDNLPVDICEALYAQGSGAVAGPYWTYRHDQSPDPARCGSGGSAMAALAFAEPGPYPAAYDGALFVGDYVKQCIWVLKAGAGGRPDPATVETLATGVFPVDLEAGPDGRLYFVDIGLGRVSRIDFFSDNEPPVAQASATPALGPTPLQVQFDASGSTAADGHAPLTYTWDLDGDGAYDDAQGVSATRTYTASVNVTVGLRVADGLGAAGTDTVEIQPGNTLPTLTITSPSPAITWAAGDTVPFSGTATDDEDGALTDAIEWSVILHHCATPTDCHEHPQIERTGAGGSFDAPEHEYPAYLEFRAQVTDARGAVALASVRLDPQTIELSVASDPPGLRLLAGAADSVAPFNITVISGSHVSVSAPSPQVTSSGTYAFVSWSDGGAASHEFLAGSTNETLTARYAPIAAGWAHVGTGPLADSVAITANVAYPAGIQAGDLLLLGCQGRNNAADWSAPGFSSLARSTVAGGLRLEVLSAWATGAVSGSLIVSNANKLNGWSCALSVFRGGAGSGAALDATPVIAGGSGSTMTAAALATSTPGALVTRWYASNDDNDHGNPSAADTLAFGGTAYHTGTGVDHAASLSYRVAAGAGSSGTASMQQRANAADAWTAMTLAFRPAAGPPPNSPPVAAAQSVVTNEEAPLLVTLSANDPDGDPISFGITALPSNGALYAGNGTAAVNLIEPSDLPFSLSGNQVTYLPAVNFDGNDSFTFSADDGLATDTAAVLIAVLPVDDPPVAVDDAYATAQETTLVVDAANGVLANDSDPDGDALTAHLVGDVENGTLTLSANGSFTYAPGPGFTGSDAFTYFTQAGPGSSSLATSTITLASNSPPVAAAQSVVTNEEAPLLVTLSANDPDGDPISFGITALPSNGALYAGNGTAAVNLIEPSDLPFSLSGNQVTYLPAVNFDGNDSFTFSADDGLATDTAAVLIAVLPVDDPPAGWAHVGTGPLADSVAITANVAYPAGIQAGDLLLLGCQGRNNAADWSAPGFSSLARSTVAGGLRLEVLSAWATGAVSGSLIVSNANKLNGWSCALSVFRGGAGSGAALDATPVIAGGSGSTMTAAALATSTPGALVTRWYASNDDNDHGNPSAADTLAFGGTAYHTGTGVDHAASLSYRVAAGAGSSGTASMQQRANAADAWTAMTLAFRPAAGP